MDEQTIKLLEECCSGCRMAVESFEQIKEYVKDTDLKKLISIPKNTEVSKRRPLLFSKSPAMKSSLPDLWRALCRASQRR